MEAIGIIGILLGIVAIVFLIMKGYSLLVAAPIATVIVLLFNGQPIIAMMFGSEKSYMMELAAFVANNFSIFMLGSIMAKYMDKSRATVSIADKLLGWVGTDNPFNALLAIFIISALMTYGGINVFVVIFALIPLARPIFKKLNISWKLVCIPIFGGAATFTMTMLPGSPALHNVVPSQALGTPLTAAPMIGIITSIVTIIYLLVYMRYVLNRSIVKGEKYEGDPPGTAVVDADAEIPSFGKSILPIAVLIAIILLFSDVEKIIIVALFSAVVLSAVLFNPYIKSQVSVVNEGATDSLGTTLNTASTIAFGTMTTAVPAFQTIFNGIVGLPGSPLFSLGIGTAVLGGITASAVGAIGISVTSFAPVYMDMGINPELIHRIISISSCLITIVPHAGFLAAFNKVSNLEFKDTYWKGFIAINGASILAFIVALTLAGFGIV